MKVCAVALAHMMTNVPTWGAADIHRGRRAIVRGSLKGKIGRFGAFVIQHPRTFFFIIGLIDTF